MYATLKDTVTIDGKKSFTIDVLNPPGMFQDGVRVQEWSTKNLLPMSGKLITEFDRRRNIRDMFSKKPSLPTAESSNGMMSTENILDESFQSASDTQQPTIEQPLHREATVGAPSFSKASSARSSREPSKRSQKEHFLPVAKRAKSTSQPSVQGDSQKGQKSLKGFFQPKGSSKPPSQSESYDGAGEQKVIDSAGVEPQIPDNNASLDATTANTPTPSPGRSQQSSGDSFIDPIMAKESWGRLFIKPLAPKCEHDEPCKTMLTKKTGVNCGRSFWMCARPLGPSGNKEKGTQWRCSTFIWASDWNGGG